MLVKAEQKYIRVSPIKLRNVASMIKKSSSPQTAIAYLEHVQKSASAPLIKTLKQAVANATNNHGLMPDTLVIRQLMIGEGPTFKRWMAVSRGMAHPIAKKTAHIRVILENVEKKVQEVRKVRDVPEVSQVSDVSPADAKAMAGKQVSEVSEGKVKTKMKKGEK